MDDLTSNLKNGTRRKLIALALFLFSTSCYADLTTGLIAHYPFNGNANDESGNGYHGTVIGAMLTADRNNNAASAYEFDGTNDYISIGALDVPSWSAYTVSAWFLNDGGGDTSPGYGQKIIDKTIFWHDFYLSVHPDQGQLIYKTYEGGGDAIVDNSQSFRDGQWHHVLVKKNGSAGEMWVDGELVGISTNVRTVFSSGPLLVGYSLSSDSFQRKYWSGKIDDIRIYNRALSESEIRQLGPAVYSCVGFEAPMNGGPVSVKTNRALPLKAQLLDFNGNAIDETQIEAPPVIQVTFEPGTPSAVDVTEDAVPVGLGTEGNEFVFKELKWRYNLKTKAFAASGTYLVEMVSGDSYSIYPTCAASFVIQ